MQRTRIDHDSPPLEQQYRLRLSLSVEHLCAAEHFARCCAANPRPRGPIARAEEGRTSSSVALKIHLRKWSWPRSPTSSRPTKPRDGRSAKSLTSKVNVGGSARSTVRVGNCFIATLVPAFGTGPLVGAGFAFYGAAHIFPGPPFANRAQCYGPWGAAHYSALEQ